MTNNLHYPPPWYLMGEGFIIPFLGNKKKLLEKGFMSEEDKKSYRGGLGACMVVNYETSNVGPYFELLFIPGDFEYINDSNGKKKSKLYKRITKIYVSSEMSIQEGRLNWAIPKEFANFTWTKEKNTTKITASTQDGNTFLNAEFTKKFISFPITTRLYPVSLLQESSEGEFINTKFSGYGKGKVASINKWIVDENSFVNLKSISNFYFALSTDEFNITFPLPEIIR